MKRQRGFCGRIRVAEDHDRVHPYGAEWAPRLGFPHLDVDNAGLDLLRGKFDNGWRSIQHDPALGPHVTHAGYNSARFKQGGAFGKDFNAYGQGGDG